LTQDILYFILFILLGITFFQDCKSRRIFIGLPVLILITSIFLSEGFVASYLVLNIIVIVLIILGLTLYYSISKRRFINPINRFLGVGDLFFMLSIVPLFSTHKFILFLIIGFIISLIIHLCYSFFYKVKTIPLAGYLSGFLMILVLCNVFLFNYNLFNGG